MSEIISRYDDVCFSYVDVGSGSPLLFSHANGFPASVYNPIFHMMENDFHTMGLNFCGASGCRIDCLEGSRRFKNWIPLADNIIRFIELVVGEPVVAAGHSMSGTIIAIASVMRPDLFKKIVLLDPVFLHPKIMNFMRFLALTRQRHRTPLAVGARRRRDNWTSRKEAREYFSGKSLFNCWDERMFDSYIENGLVETPDGVELAFPKGLEAFLFGSIPTSKWKYIKRMKKETMVVRGEKSDVLTDDTWEFLKRTRPDVEYLELPKLGHLFPMQAPEMTAEIIVDFAS